METDTNGYERDNSLPLRPITIEKVIDRITSWADFHKSNCCNVEDWRGCDRDLAEVLSFIRQHGEIPKH